MVTELVVGVDGSPESDDAMVWALAEARRRGVPVRAVHVWPPEPPSEGLDDQLHREVAAHVHEVVERAAAIDVTVKTEVVYGHPAETLIRLAGAEALLVVGSRGRGALAGTVLGSVSQSSAQYGTGTVVVARGERPGAATGPVVAGVDGSEGSVAAVRFADEAARLRGVPLRVVYAWSAPYLGFAGPASRLPQEVIDELRALAETAALESLIRAGVDTARSDVEVAPAYGPPGPALLSAAEEASLLVVGSRGYGGWKGLLLGSVSQQAVTHSPAPVAVVRPAQS